MATLTLERIEKHYDGQHVVGPIDLDVEPGELVVVVGPSGCGKSTLLLTIAGLLDSTDGAIIRNGKPIRGPQTDIGMVFQGNVLVDWRDVLGNVLLQIEMRGLSVRPYVARARELLQSVGLQDFERRYPHELSGGMQQRTAFCRALIHDPSLILMDEPLGALDALTRERLRSDLERLWMQRRKTVVFVTHSIEEAVQLSDTVVVISPRPGTIVREIAIDLPRPRTLAVCKTPAFHALVDEIKQIFFGYGVL
ncbi:MAG TPA: ABC transporter ATP-binding protein [Stellaceae bacterium]|nr:ABC transporter ATP-binding protein [Stellaceae bacterium]